MDGFEWKLSEKNDGTCEGSCFYYNLSDAFTATKLDGIEIGDNGGKKFRVEINWDTQLYEASKLVSVGDDEKDQCRTILIPEVPEAVSIDDIKAIYSSCGIIRCYKTVPKSEGSRSIFMEFETAAAAFTAFKLQNEKLTEFNIKKIVEEDRVADRAIAVEVKVERALLDPRGADQGIEGDLVLGLPGAIGDLDLATAGGILDHDPDTAEDQAQEIVGDIAPDHAVAIGDK